MLVPNDILNASLFDLRRRISAKAGCKTMDAVAAANRLRSMVDRLPGKPEAKLAKVLEITELSDDVSAETLLDILIDKWWGILRPCIQHYDRAEHESHPRSIPVRRTIKKAAVYYATYEIQDRQEFDDLVTRYSKPNGYPEITIGEQEYPKITLTAKTPFEITLVNRRVNAYAVESNVLETI